MAGCFFHFHIPLHNSKHRLKTKSLENLIPEPATPPNSPKILTRSLDTTDMTLMSSNKFPGKLGRLFRSRSEQGLKNSSPKPSPTSSPKTSSAPRRRLLRVVRDDKSEGEEWENPHVIRRYSKSYWEKQMEEARALQHSTSLPYDVNSDHTILKKTSYNSGSTDSDNDSVTNHVLQHQSSSCTEGGTNSPTTDRHACFSDDVEVIEFIGKEKITKQVFFKHEAKLVDSDSEEVICESSEECTEIVTSSGDGQKTVDIKRVLREERIDEFKKAKESLDSITDCDEEDDVITSIISSEHTIMSSDTGTTSDASGCSDTEEPKKKQKKKRVKFFQMISASASRSSSGESDSLHSGKKQQKISKKLLGLHLQDEIDMTDSDSDMVKLELIPEQ